MKKARQFILSFFVLALLPCLSSAQETLPEEFVDGLKRAKMTYTMPEGFEEVDIVDNPHMKYEYAIRNKDETIEIRYAIRPIDSLLIRDKEKNDDDITYSVSANEIAAIMHVSVAMNISGEMDPNKLNINLLGSTQEAIQSEFGADDGVSIPLLKLQSKFSENYKGGMFISIWKENLGTAMVFFLFKNLEEVNMNEWKQSFYCLKFE